MSVNRLDGRSDINSLLSQMRELKAQAQNSGQISALANRDIAALDKPSSINALDAVQNSDAPGFTQLLKQAINSVNDTQGAANDLRTSYELGDSRVSLNQVMVAAQKSTISFEAMTQVRNRLVEAYQDVMNMPI
jgi:flagellar hook-basal body complex protein FliE